MVPREQCGSVRGSARGEESLPVAAIFLSSLVHQVRTILGWDEHDRPTTKSRKVSATATRVLTWKLTTPMQHLRHWFNNHTGVRAKKNSSVAKIHTGGKAPRDPFAPVLLGAGADRPKQKFQVKQAYGVMLRDTSLKSDIDNKWKIKLAEEPELATMQGAYLRYFTMHVGQEVQH